MLKQKRRRGDRRDGRLVRSIPAFTKFMPFIMPTRNDACNYYEESFEITAVEQLLRRLRSDGCRGISPLHFLLAAYVRCAAEYPGVNRFVAGRRIYAHNKLEVIMIVKKELALDSDETAIKVVFEPTDTILDVYRKFDEKVQEVKTSPEDNGTEKAANLLCKAPRWLLSFIISILNTLDYYDKLPRALIDVSPFHGSLIITDLGSIGIGPVFHHIYNFGTLPAFVAFGSKRRCYELNAEGQVEQRRYIDCKFTLDERIVDGYYYAKFLRAYRRLFLHPELLEAPPEKVAQDVP